MTMENEYGAIKVFNTFAIRCPFELYKHFTKGAYSISLFEARLFNLSPADYLKWLEKEYGVEFRAYGNFIGYGFKKESDANAHARALSRRYQAFVGK